MINMTYNDKHTEIRPKEVSDKLVSAHQKRNAHAFSFLALYAKVEFRTIGIFQQFNCPNPVWHM